MSRVCARCGKQFVTKDCLEKHDRGAHERSNIICLKMWKTVFELRSLHYLKTWWCNLYLNFFSEYGWRMKVFCVQGVGNALRL